MLRTLAALALLVALAPACASNEAAPARTPLAVFAASSLTEAFHDLEQAFEAAHPEVDLQLTFAGSQVLRLQIEQGAAADVFASANPQHAEALARAGLASASVPFAWNELVVVVPPGSPVATFADLPKASRLVIGTEHVPVGQYTRQLLDRARVQLGAAFGDAVRARVVSEESNVRLVRAKVELGEADAAIVYRTDAASDRVRQVAIPAALNVRASYPIAALTGSPRPAQAAAFVAFTRSEPARAILARHGFLTDPP